MLNLYINQQQYEFEREFEIAEQAGNKTASTFSVLATPPLAPPKSGDVIELIDSDTNTTYFWGLCGIPKSPEYTTGNELPLYSITCNNANALLANRIINVAFQQYTVSQIVQQLFNQYISSEGIALGQISDIPIVVDVYTGSDYNLQDALDELADLVSATWQVGTDHKFYFIVEEDFPNFPTVIDSDFLLGTGYQHTTKDYKVRTVQYISGATDLTSTQTETFTYEEDQDAFILVFPLAEKPSITVNGTPVPDELIGVNGLSDDDPNIVFMFSYDSESVGYNSQTDYLSVGDQVVFSYTGLFPIRISVANNTKIAEIAAKTGTSGRKEEVQIAANIKTTQDAIQLAQALLSQFESETEEVTFWLLSDQLYQLGLSIDNTKVLTQVSINLPAINIVGNFVISERTVEPFYADLSDFEQKVKITLKLVNRDYLKSYGEVLSSIRRDVNQLSIREDVIVISAQNISDTMALSEIVDTGNIINLPFPTPALINGSLIAPFDFGLPIYPESDVT